MRRLPLLACFAALAAATAAAQDSPRHLNALVAGYKAAFLCSGSSTPA